VIVTQNIISIEMKITSIVNLSIPIQGKYKKIEGIEKRRMGGIRYYPDFQFSPIKVSGA
jgi:hypothetical protein